MNRLFVLLAVVSFSAIVFAEKGPTSGVATQDDDNAPLMMAFAELKWTKLPESCRAGSECVFNQEGKDKFDFKAAGEANEH